MYFCNRFKNVVITKMIDAKDYLLEKGIRPSPQRVAVMRFLLEHRIHPTVDMVFSELHKMMPTLSKTTIYNTLKLLEEKGAIQVLNIDDKNVRLDGEVTPHAHFLCRKCGSLFDVPLSQQAVNLLSSVSQIPEFSGFEVRATQIYHKGLCPKCKNEQTD